MKTGNNGIKLIKDFEGCSLKAYRDPVTGNLPITIGYGNTFYEDGSKIKLTDTITKEEAEDLLNSLLPRFEKIVNSKVTVKLTQNQFDALMSHTWNTGGSKTLFHFINSNAGDNAIKNWFLTKYITADGNPSSGLERRRKAESELYFKK